MSDAATTCAYCSTPLPESGRFCPNCGRSTAESNVEDPLIGQIIMGQFTVESRLGRGGWATVYLAHQMALDRKVAIKVLHREFVGEEEPVQRFFREARSSSALDHPNILRPWLVGRLEDGTPYLIMDYVEGGTLSELIQEEGRIPVRRTLQIAVQLASALGEADRRGVVHRDLKPSNVFLTTNERGLDVVKLADFGIAKVLNDEESQAHLTRTGDILGTPAYMAPEQAMGRSVDHRTDLYGLGAILYHMLSGKTPFEEASLVALLAAHVGKHPRALCEVVPPEDLPVGLEDLVMRLLAKDPAQRPQAAREVVEELVYVSGRVGGLAGAFGSADVVPPAVPQRSTASDTGLDIPVAGFERDALDAGQREDGDDELPGGRKTPTVFLRGTGEQLDDEDAIATVVKRSSLDEGGPIPLAGTGRPGHGGDGGPGTSADFHAPTSVAQDVHGNVFIVDSGNHCVRFLDARTGEVRTLAGVALESGFCGDEGPANEAMFNDPRGIALDTMGNLYIADCGNQRVRAIDVRSGMIGTVVGSGRTGAAREGTDAHLAGVVPRDLALMPDGSLLIADAVNHRVWIVSALEGAVSTLAGTGMAGLSGDGGAAAEASLDGPTGVAVGPAGIVYIADRNNGRIRTVDPHSGRIETIAGADGSLGEPSALTIAMDGSLRITDAQGGRVLSVDARTGRVRPLVGDLLGPEGIFIDPQNTLIVAETGRHRVWAVIEKS